MLKQVLITLLVAAIVIMLARIQRARQRAATPRPAAAAEAWYRSPSAIVGLIFAVLVVLSSSAVTGYRYWVANQIVQVEVIDPASGTRTLYQVKRKDLGEREFRTVDGRRVLLGAGDRVERIE